MSDLERVSVSNHFVDLPLVNWEQYINALDRDRVYNVVTEYDRLDGYGPSEGSKFDTDSNYTRCMVQIEKFTNPAKVTLKQFKAQLQEAGVKTMTSSETLNRSVEDACLIAIENFAVLEQYVIVDLGKDQYVLAPTKKDSIVMKLVDATQGAIIIYTPKWFVPFKAKKEPV